MTKNNAFSLVELSIVLVILGLLTGGILTGQSLIRASELRSISTDLNRYVTATQTFRDKYFALPGDMRNATAFWGTAANCPGTAAQPSTTAATCNGDGNGIVIDISGNPNSNEIYRFWQHLANAGLVEGTFTGVTGPGHVNYNSVNGWNVPRAKISNTGFSIYHWSSIDISAAWAFEGSYGNVILVGTESAVTPNQGFFLRAEEMWNVDTKMDDGRPGLGKIVTYESHTSCHTATPSTTAAVAGTAEYALTNSTIGCAMVFRQAF